MVSPRSHSPRRIAWLLLFVVVCLGWSVKLPAAPVPPDKPAHYPAWWFEQEVIKRSNPQNGSPLWQAGAYPASDDYLALNQGQLKNFANSAYMALQAVAPGVLGADLTDLISSFRPRNLTRAAGVSASQSTTLAEGVAANAVDGNTDGHYWHGSLSHTDRDIDPWLQVNLGGLKTIQSVEVWNRTDGAGERTVNFYVFVSRTEMGNRSLPALLADTTVWRSAKITSPPTPKTTIQVPAVAGQFVMVRIEGTQYLHLAEVVISGFDALDFTRAPGVSATQSSTYIDEVASRAIDGNTDGDALRGSVSITNANSNPWWQVDLKEMRNIDAVELWNRTDGTSERLSNFYVLVSPTDMSTRTLNELLVDTSVWKSPKITTPPSPNATIPVPAIAGQYVMVRIQGTQYLQLAEVVVKGRTIADDYAAANLGQLKNVAKPFYDRMQLFGFPSVPPWQTSSSPADDFAIANLGQAKNVFRLDVSGFTALLNGIGNRVPEWWKAVNAQSNPNFSLQAFGLPGYYSTPASPGISTSGTPNPKNLISAQEDLFKSSMIGRDSPPPPVLRRIENPVTWADYRDRRACTIEFTFPEEYRNHINGFSVYRRVVSLNPAEDGLWKKIANLAANAEMYRDTGLRGDERYYYRITTRSSFGESNPSNHCGFSPPLDPWARFSRAGVSMLWSSAEWYYDEDTTNVLLFPYTEGWESIEGQQRCFFIPLDENELELEDVAPEDFVKKMLDALPAFGQYALEDISERGGSGVSGGVIIAEGGGCYSDAGDAGGACAIVDCAYDWQYYGTPYASLRIHPGTGAQRVKYSIDTIPGSTINWTEVFKWSRDGLLKGAKSIARRTGNHARPPAEYELTPKLEDLDLAGIGSYDNEQGIGLGQYGLISDVDLVIEPKPHDSEQNEWPDAFEADPRVSPKLPLGESLRVRIRYFTTLEWATDPDYYTTLTWDHTKFDLYKESPVGSGLPPTPLMTSGYIVVGNATLLVYPKPDAKVGDVFRLQADGSYGGILLGQDIVEVSVGDPKPSSSYTGPNYRFPFEEATGAQYRKIGLNGRPLADAKPQNKPESDGAAEETFIDALTLGLRHSTTDVYIPIPGADFAAEAKRVVTSEVWMTKSGLRPHERPDRPFGAGWTSNLSASLEHVRSTDSSGLEDVYVTAHNGVTYHFIGNAGGWIPKATGRHEQWMYGASLSIEVREDREVWVLRAGKGTEIVFEGIGGTSSPMVPVLQRIVGVDRERGRADPGTEPIKSNAHNFYRIQSVVDRFGNRLVYNFGGNLSLVPTQISAGRVGGSSTIVKLSISQNAVGHITDIWDANGNRWKYEYDTTSHQYTSPLIPNFTYRESVLVKVIAPDSTETSFGYEFNKEDDTFAPREEGEAMATYWHLNLNRITNPDGQVYGFTYSRDLTKQSFDSRVGYFTQVGRPRWVESVQLPHGSTKFWNKPPEQPNWSVRVGYNAASLKFENANQPARYTRVQDAAGKFIVYTWSDVKPLPVTAVAAPNVVALSTSLVLCYKEMKIDYGALGSETFRFNEAAGLALSETRDLSQNITKFYQEDPLLGGATPFANAFEPFAEETTREVSAIGGTNDPLTGQARTGERLFQYKEIAIGGQSCRFLEKITEEGGRTTEYTMDAKGRTTVEKRTGPQGGMLETHFHYDDEDHPGVVTKKEVKRNGSDTSIPTSLITDYTLNANGQVHKENILLGARTLVTTYTYDANGNRLSTEDANGHLTGFSYNSRNQLIKVEYPGKFTRLFAYDGRGNKVKETDENGNITTYVYDGMNRLLSENRGGAVTQYAYNKVGSRVSVTDARGFVTITDYDDLQRPVKVTDPLGGATRYEYGLNSGGRVTEGDGFKPTKITDARGVVTEFEYDKLYRQTRKWIQYKPGVIAEWKTFYDTAGNVVKEIEPERSGGALRIATVKEYDGVNRLKRIIFADQSEEEYFYNSVGLKWKTLAKRSATDAAGLATVTAFDGAGRAVTVTAPAVPDQDDVLQTPLTKTDYDDVGNIVSVTDPRLKTTSFLYDGRNRKVKEMRPAVPIGLNGPIDAPTVCYAYDAVGNVVATRDANWAVTFNAYDQWNRLILTQRPGNGGKVFTGYDKVGNVVQVTDANGYITRNVYDALNRLRSSTDAQSITVSYEYDAVGNRTKITDGKGQQTLFGYEDGLNRNTSITYPSSLPISFVYDGVNKIKRVDSTLRTTNYTYDDRNRLKTVKYVGRAEDDREYGYDKFGNLLNVIEAAPAKGGKANVSYTYDALRRVLTETSGGVTHTYKYDVAGNRMKAIYGGNGPTLVSGYDALNRLSTVTEGARVTSYAYDLNGNIVHKKLPNNDTVTTIYDELNRARSIIGRGASVGGQPGPLYYSYEMQYDPVGNLVSSEEAYGGSLQPRTLTLEYDRVNRLTKETALQGGIAKVTSYVYDAANNRSRKDVQTGMGAPVITFYVHNNRNQLTSYSGGVSLTYDNNGNRATRTRGVQVDTYAYDYENRLIRYDGENTQAGVSHFTYAYDYRSRRVEIAPGGVPATKVIFSGGTSVREIENGTTTVEYVRGSDYGGGVGGILYSIRSGTPSFTHYDGRGDVTTKTNVAGAITWQSSYEAFGKRTQEQGSTQDRQKANTKEEDPTGLLNEGFRYRDLETGSFITRDPAGFVDGLNLYTYVNQNPWSKFDPEGLYQQTPAALMPPGLEASQEYRAGFQEGMGKAAVGVYEFVKPSPHQQYRAAREGAEKMADSEASTSDRVAGGFSYLGHSIMTVLEVVPAVSGVSKQIGRLAGKAEAKVAVQMEKTAAKVTEETVEVVEREAAKGPPNPGGRLGKASTRTQIDDIATEMEKRGFEITGGGNRLPEEYLPGPGGGRKGSSFPDITATKNGRTVRVNTVDTRANGVTPTTRETNNAARIRSQTPGDHLLLVPKPKP